LLFFVGTCAPPPPSPTYAFYHWQTKLAVPPEILREYDARRVYVKAFDVSWTDGRASPSAILEVEDVTRADYVPVIFITNEVMRYDSPTLVNDVVGLLGRSFPFDHDEIQIDCDWTAGTQVQYFQFLKKLADISGKSISCTLRLHQYRDRERQGVPPVDRVVLMAYNTGDLGKWETENSIVDTTVIAAYVKGQPLYPLPLDLAVAAYDWAAVYRYGELAYLINEPELEELADTSRFTPLTDLRYKVHKSTYYSGLYLYRNDLLRREIVDRASAERLARSLWPRVANAGSRYLVIYRINSRQWTAPLPPL
jgi:hypothetical protein